jgi:hypothetical protein
MSSLPAAREIHLLVEDAMSLILLHSDPAYAAAAAEAAKRLIQDVPVRCLPAASATA